MSKKEKMSWTIYLQSIKDPNIGKKVDIVAETYPQAQLAAIKQAGQDKFKLYGYPEDYFKKD
jgi:hypothetical protein